MLLSLFLSLVLSAGGPATGAGPSRAQSRDGLRATAGGQTETKHLTVATLAPAGAVAPGARVSLVIQVAPKPEMHVYAPEQKGLIPISLVLEPTRAVKAHAARFPKSETFTPLDEVQFVYSKPFRIVQDVTVSAAPPAGTTLTVKGTLKYQACDNAICYAPVTVPVSWTINLKSATPPY
jgi:DsbC/DsbD-like thiol-disulfide interchange protein